MTVSLEGRSFLQSLESTDAHGRASDELHLINPRLSLLLISSNLISRNKRYTWVSFGCKSTGRVRESLQPQACGRETAEMKAAETTVYPQRSIF